MNRLFEFLRNFGNNDEVMLPITDDVKADLRWFSEWLEGYNGTSIIRSFSVPTAQIVVDACLDGFGGYLVNEEYYEGNWSEEVKGQDFSISSLECLNCLHAIRHFKDKLAGTTVLLLCDNISSVNSLVSGKARDPIIAGVLRETWKICFQNDIHLIVEHRHGINMAVPDILSRKYRGQAEKQKFQYLASIINGIQRNLSKSDQKLPEEYVFKVNC